MYTVHHTLWKEKGEKKDEEDGINREKREKQK